MDKITTEEKKSERKDLLHQLKAKAKKAVDRAKKFTRLEVVGLVAIFILIATSLFNFKLTVTRKPWLAALTRNMRMSIVGSNTLPAIVDSELDPAVVAAVLSAEGVVLPAVWGDLGKRLVASGVIDKKKFEQLYAGRGGIDPEMKKLLEDSSNGRLKITQDNASFLLNLLWALGLGNKNDILENGEMNSPQYGGDPGRFASTGGWTLSTGNAMDHYSKHTFITLTADQQALVDRVSRGIYRPCCGNSTHFPDCNHGMAMLALLELLASQGVSEQEMYQAALAANSYWFPDTYLTIAKYLQTQDRDYRDTPPSVLLSAEYSSAQGYRQILQKVTPTSTGGGGGCGA